MAVNNYIRNKCQYNLNKLDNYIYLYDFTNPILDYITDENETNATSKEIKGNCYEIYCDSVQYTSNSSNDNRFYFDNTLTVTINEAESELYYKLIDKIIKGSWMVLFKNVEGDIFVMNGEYPIMVTYQYVINDEKTPNTLTITFKVLQNVPTINYRASVNVSEIWRSKPCSYVLSRIKSLKMIDKKRCDIDVETDYLHITQKGEGAFKDIEFNPTSMTFTDSFDGNEYTQTLSFTIPFNSYIYFFHYNLLEYLDNRYYALISTTNGNHIFSGYKKGLFPSYTINANEDNTINITLINKSNSHSTIAASAYTLSIVEYKEYVKLLGDCIDNYYTYTLLQELNTENYYCLKGYEDEYADYNIVGTYDKFDTTYGFKLIDYRYDCFNECAIEGLPSSIVFSLSGTNTKSFTVTSKCDFTFEYDNTLCSVDYQGTTLTVTNLSTNEGTYNINVLSENGTVYRILCLVTNAVDADQTIHITAQEQKVTVNPINGITNITSVNTTLPYVPNQYGNGYVFSVPRNNSTENDIEYIITIKYNDNTTETILIIQDNLYEALVATDLQECYDGDLYSKYKRLIGYTPDSMSIDAGYVKGELLESDSISCENYDKKETVDTICYEGHLYNVVRYSLEGVTIKEQAELDGETCTDVGYGKWIINSGKTICVDGVPYYKEELWISKDNSKFYIVYPIEERTSTVEAPDSNICNVVGDIDKTVYKWVYTDGSYCLPDTYVEGVDYNCETTNDVTYIEGDKSTYMCYKGNKYRVKANLISTHCDGDYRVYGYEQGTLIEENCEECGYVKEQTCEISKEVVLSNPTVYYDGADVEYNEFAVPIVSGFVTTTVIDKKCNTYVQTAFTELEDYTITYSPSGENTTNDNRDIIATVKFNDEKIGEFKYIQKLNPNNSGGGEEPSEPEEPDKPDTPTGETNCTSSTTTNECDGYNLYEVTTYYVDANCDGNWVISGTPISVLIEENSTECGYVEPIIPDDTLSFTYSGNSMTYKLNNTTYTANTGNSTTNSDGTNTYSKTLSDLGVDSFTNAYTMFSGKTGLTTVTSIPTTTNVTNMNNMFSGCKNLKSINTTNFDLTNVQYMNNMFSGCTSLTEIDASGWDLRSVSSITNTFSYCSGLTTLDLSGWDVSNVTNMKNMFTYCRGLTSLDLSGWNLDKIEASYGDYFYNCINLTEIIMNGCTPKTVEIVKNNLYNNSILDKVTIITDTEVYDTLSFEYTGSYSIYSVNDSVYTATTSPYSVTKYELADTYPTSAISFGTNVTKINSFFDTSSITNMGKMFSGRTGLTEINFVGFNTSNATAMYGMFDNCTSLTSLDLSSFDTSNVTAMNTMFNNCTGLTSLDLSSFDTSNVTTMKWMFSYCTSLTTLNVSGWDMNNVTNVAGMFDYCNNLTTIYAYGCDSTTIDKLNSAKPSSCTIIY